MKKISNFIFSIPAIYSILFILYAVFSYVTFVPYGLYPGEYMPYTFLWSFLLLAIGLMSVVTILGTILFFSSHILRGRFALWSTLVYSYLEYSYRLSSLVLSVIAITLLSLWSPFGMIVSMIMVIFAITSLPLVLLRPKSNWTTFLRLRGQPLLRSIFQVISIFAAIAGLLLCLIVYLESQPELYQDIVFGDKQGKYVINYDGDYWLTYYTDSNKCFQSKNECYPNFVKKGNAAITSSPVALEPFIDREVVVEATVEATHANLFSNSKTLCVGTGSATSCKESLGPGTWYMTPIIINSIILK